MYYALLFIALKISHWPVIFCHLKSWTSITDMKQTLDEYIITLFVFGVNFVGSTLAV